MSGLRPVVGVTYELEDGTIVKIVERRPSGAFVWKKVFKHGGLQRKPIVGFFPSELKIAKIVSM